MTHMTTQREKLTSPLKIKNDGPGACRHQAGFPLWNGGPPPLRPFHVKGIKGFTRSTSRWFPSPYEHRSYFVHPISLRSAIGKFPCTFFDKPWNFPQGRGLGVLPMSRCDVIIPKKKQPPNLYRYIYIYITYPIDIKNDGHLKGISFQIWLSMLSWVSMLNFRYPTVIIPSPSIPLWKKPFCWWNISF